VSDSKRDHVVQGLLIQFDVTSDPPTKDDLAAERRRGEFYLKSTKVDLPLTFFLSTLLVMAVALKVYPYMKEWGISFFRDMGWNTDLVVAGLIWIPLSVVCFLSVVLVARRVWYDVSQPIIRALYRRRYQSVSDGSPINIWMSGQLAYPVTQLLRDEGEYSAHGRACKRWKSRKVVDKYMNKIKNQNREMVLGEAISIKRYLGESDDGVVPD